MPALLAAWLLAVVTNIVIALNAITEMLYFELDIPSREGLIAARPWVRGSMLGFIVLAALGWWMGSRWWQALLVASTGVVGLILLRIEDNGPIVAIPFLIVTGLGALATLFTARPFTGKKRRQPRTATAMPEA
ncbi:hypothetical protein AVP42_00321 [Agromyces sp. NDB4Y10]|uniref:hypothetical protein n=1 Tax=Agromyces sp. NDB4Y10 TaxID=1775951 RepID=UPI0007B19839|nr:hypothetical protein [Agromyces sp. NDB4Y10]KZE95561.1 hypothetical protein AVP42_00321 [Agromyces sp. NDB4Y10]